MKQQIDRRIRLPEVRRQTGLGTSCIYARMKAGHFPKQRKDGRMSYWLESEIQAWIKQS